MKRALGVAAGVLVALGLLGVFAKLVFSENFDPHAVPFMLAGKPAPPFNLKRLDTGAPVSLADLKGRPIVMNFWASWCGPCMSEHPVLDWGARALGDKVTFLGVIFEDTEENAREVLSRQPSSFAQLVDPQSQIAVDYGVAGVPETYFIDARGVIVTKQVGPLDQGTLVARVQALLKDGASQGAAP